MKKLFTISIILLGILLFVPVHAYSSPGTPVNFVSDFANVLTSEQETQLNAKLEAEEKNTSNEISVVTINSLDGDSIENYAVKLFEEYKIGKKDKDNGVLLLIAVADHKLRIEVGYGLEGALTDSESSSIITSDITPLLKQSKYFEGINKGTDSIIKSIDGEYNAENSTASVGGWEVGIFLFLLLILFAPISIAKFLGISDLNTESYSAMGPRSTADPLGNGTVGDSSSGSSGGEFSFGGFGGGSSGGGGASGSW